MTNVFLDTQVFVKKNFNYESVLFQRLIDASEDGLITIYLTDIVKNEIESKVYERVYEQVKSSFTKFNNEAKILKNLKKYKNFFDINERLDEIYSELIDQFNQYLKDASVEIISVNNVSPTIIFEMYFKGIPPFSKKKKVEFPDAFSLVALENIFKEKNEKISIVSDDTDLKNFCKTSDTLMYEPSLESFFDNLIKNENYKYHFLISVYDANYGIIESTVIDYFEEHNFILVGEDGDVDKIEVQTIELDEDPYIIDVDFEEEGTAKIAFNAIVSFIADVSYIDYSNAYYDKEERKYLLLENIGRKLEDYVTVSVFMKINYNYQDKEELDIEKVILNEGESIEISIDYF